MPTHYVVNVTAIAETPARGPVPQLGYPGVRVDHGSADANLAIDAYIATPTNACQAGDLVVAVWNGDRKQKRVLAGPLGSAVAQPEEQQPTPPIGT